MANEVENLKLRAGAAKAPLGIVPMHVLYGMARVLEDSACKYAPFNYMAQPLADAIESYMSAELRHRIACSLLGGQITAESLAAVDEDSGLPHIFHMLTGLTILATLMIRDGALKLDPGQGKRKIAASNKAAFFEALSEFDKAAAYEENLGPAFPEHYIGPDVCGVVDCRACKKAEELGAVRDEGMRY